MNNEFTNDVVYNAISSAADSFFQQLTGSNYWRIRENYVISGNSLISGINLKIQVKEFLKPNGQPILPNSSVNPQWLNAGSYFGMVSVQIPNEESFTIQIPHNKPENFMHLQKGRNKIEIPPNPNDITNFGALASGLFLKFCTKEEAISYIDKIRKSPNSSN